MATLRQYAFCLRWLSTCLVPLLVAFLFGAVGHSQTLIFSPANAMRVGSIHSEQGAHFGSCFLVDERGYVATCLSNLRNCKDAVVIFDGKTRLRVAGIVAASRGSDIALLQLIDIPKDDERFKNVLELRADDDLALETELVPWGGFGKPLPQTLTVPHVVRRLLGDEYCMGLKEVESEAFGCGANVRWIWLSQSRPLIWNGAPIFNRAGHVVAMLSAGPNRQNEVISAIRIQHVIDLIPKDSPKAKSLRTAKSWADDLAVEAKAATVGNSNVDPTTEAIGLGGGLQHGWPLATRYTAFQERVEQTLSEKSNAEQGIARTQEDQLELVAAADKLQGEISAIVPEEAYQTTESVEVPKTEQVKETRTGQDGKKETVTRERTVMVTERRTVTRMRHSKRQLDLIATLRSKLRPIQAKLEANTLLFNYNSLTRLPFVNQIAQYNRLEYFFLADPLALRPLEECEEFEAELSKRIDGGGAEGDYYLARAMARIRMGKFQLATADLKEAYDIDAGFRPLSQALHARILGLQGNQDKAALNLKSILKDNKNNARLLTVAARFEMDRGSSTAAVRYLQQASEIQPDEIELMHGLAWLLSAGSGTNSKLAYEKAVSASERTGFTDWSILAAQANTHAMFKRSELAEQAIAAAIELAPPAGKVVCKHWQIELAGGIPIKRDWK